MTIEHTKKLIFIHIPRTGGTSIYESLGIRDISHKNKFCGHKNVESWKQQYKDYWKTYLKFTVVRDPIDRFISAYKYSRMNESYWHSSKLKKKKPKHEHYDICCSLNINEYISFLYKNSKNHSIHTIPQTYFFTNKHGKIEIDYIVRYENLVDDLKKININLTKKLNSSHLMDENFLNLTPQSINMLEDMYEIDYKLINVIKNKKIDYQ